MLDSVEVDEGVPQGLPPQQTVPIPPLLDVISLLVQELVHLEGGQADILQPTHPSDRALADLFNLIL